MNKKYEVTLQIEIDPENDAFMTDTLLFVANEALRQYFRNQNLDGVVRYSTSKEVA